MKVQGKINKKSEENQKFYKIKAWKADNFIFNVKKKNHNNRDLNSKEPQSLDSNNSLKKENYHEKGKNY